MSFALCTMITKMAWDMAQLKFALIIEVKLHVCLPRSRFSFWCFWLEEPCAWFNARKLCIRVQRLEKMDIRANYPYCDEDKKKNVSLLNVFLQSVTCYGYPIWNVQGRVNTP